MKSHQLLSLLATVQFALAIDITPLSSVKKGTNTGIVPNRFIVELDDASLLSEKRSTLSIHERLYHSIKARDVSFEVDKEYTSDIFDGVALTLEDSQNIAELEAIEGVKAILPIKNYPRPSPVKWEPVSTESPAKSDLQSTHIQTGVDMLHAEGNIGKGISIGILDTGIDYTHPALGGGIGPGRKINRGYDFVGDNYNGGNAPVPDDDPLDQCSGHGTHVAGIIGADPENPFNISGVAYGANISAYRIFGCTGGVNDDVIIDALITGYQNGDDILSLSLGGADGWTTGAGSVVASRIAKRGVVVTIAAGNAGAAGAWFTSGPGNGIDVISVASADNIVIPLQNVTVIGVDYAPIPFFSTFPLQITEALPLYAISDDACNPLPDNTPDLSPYAVLIRDGGCTSVQKLTNAAAKGAKVALIYTNSHGFNTISIGDSLAILIQAADGEFLVSQLATGASISVTFPQPGSATQSPNPTGGLVSEFTSYGPTNDFFFKPSITAPGGGILSTLPVPFGSYGVLSGTSMATPFVAGSAALVLVSKGKGIAKDIRSLFEATATVIPQDHTDGSPPHTVAQQGAGLINVYDAIYGTTKLSPTQLIVNDTAHAVNIHTITIQNNSKRAKTYQITHDPAGTAQTVTPGTEFVHVGPVPIIDASAVVKLSATSTTLNVSPLVKLSALSMTLNVNPLIKLSATSITLGPGQTKQVQVTINAPAGLDPTTLPVFSGFITFTSGSDVTHASYLGLASALKDRKILDVSSDFFGVPLPTVLGPFGEVQERPINYTFVNGDFPSFLFRLNFGSPVVSLDLVPVKTLFSPRAQTAGSLSIMQYLSRNDLAGANPYYIIDLPTPTFANGTAIPPGLYTVLLRTLRVTGNRANSSDYETWTSPVIGVQNP